MFGTAQLHARTVMSSSVSDNVTIFKAVHHYATKPSHSKSEFPATVFYVAAKQFLRVLHKYFKHFMNKLLSDLELMKPLSFSQQKYLTKGP